VTRPTVSYGGVPVVEPLAAMSEASEWHREQVGGLWNELGPMQLAFLRRQGLTPATTLLDIGCGCLRGGVHFVGFLQPGRYFGIDRSAALLRAGLEIELPRAGLDGRLAADHLLENGDFEAWRFGTRFDIGWAQSLFTHLPAAEIRRCLAQLARCLRPPGRLFATFFAGGPDPGQPVTHSPGGITTYADQDPYHYRFADLTALCDGLPWRAVYIGDWRHPRAQQMARFDRLA
jgi:SAM-dependent methyltransferase